MAESYDYTESEQEYGAEPESEFIVNHELQTARRLVEETGANLFLTGKAGTGKTTFLHNLRKHSRKRMVVLAPTGIAAINAGGSTIHSFFQFPLTPFIPGRGFIGQEGYYKLSRNTLRIVRSLDLLVIDEVSMVRPDLMDAIDSALRRHRRSPLPFGGVQLLLIGDLRQLQPVLKDEEARMLADFYSSPYFFDSRALKEAGFFTVELQTIFRQRDRQFIEMLNAVRDGKADNAVLQSLNRHCHPGFAPADEEGYIRLTTHNLLANDINRSRLEALPAPPVKYKANVSGSFPESSYPAEKELTLKVGARVMFIRNDTADRQYFNGLTGTVTHTSRSSVKVRVGAAGSGYRTIEVGAVEWEKTRYTINENTKDVTQEVEGKFRQLPLRLAWAITIHKSQGLTFDRAIIDASSSFAAGQAYVALSRCRTLEGMVLETPLSPQAIITDPAVSAFLAQASVSQPDESTVARLSDDFFMRTLADVFDFDPLAAYFDTLHRAIEEYATPLSEYRKFREPYAEASVKLEQTVAPVGRQFAYRYTASGLSAGALKDSEKLRQKIQSGCRYFLGHLRSIGDLLSATTAISLDNKAYQSRISKALEDTLREFNMKCGVLRLMSDKDFSVESYQEAKARIAVDLETGGKTRKVKTKTPKPPKEKKPKGYSRMETLKLFRAGKGVEEIAIERALAIGTVLRHLADCIADGLLRLDEVIPAQEIAAYDAILTADPGITAWKDFINRTSETSDRNHALLYWYTHKPTD